MLFIFSIFSLDFIFIPKSLSLSSKIIFSAIFFPIHFIDSIVLLSSDSIANISLSNQRDNICIATFQPTQDIFISSVNTFFSHKSRKPKRLSLFSVL
ncbi:MAG: hypothetical protein P1U46_01905 [Patescibacteria group bacterium]|nr:hypothetical protein [Patescibacteria group bacterium]